MTVVRDNPPFSPLPLRTFPPTHPPTYTHPNVRDASQGADVTSLHLLHRHAREVVIHKQLVDLALSHLAGLKAAAQRHLQQVGKISRDIKRARENKSVNRPCTQS